jgi:DNA mismatch endonuclease Vsr
LVKCSRRSEKKLSADRNGDDGAMADVLSKEQRKYNMSRIRGKNTKPEELVRKYLFSKGLRYRKNDKRLPGQPDIVLPKYRTIVFVHGCFWHMHEGCRYFVLPATNTEFWKNKLEGNRERVSCIANLICWMMPSSHAAAIGMPTGLTRKAITRRMMPFFGE